jgi:putative transposase
MWCPHCESADRSERRDRTALGYRRFRCHTCKREFNERTGTRFTHLQYPTDVVCLVVFWRVRYQLSLRDLPEMFLERGLVFTHKAVREWEAQLAPLVSETVRKHRRGRIGCSWYVDELFIRVKGRRLRHRTDRDGVGTCLLHRSPPNQGAEACSGAGWGVFPWEANLFSPPSIAAISQADIGNQRE